MAEVQKLTNNKEIIAYLAEKFPLCFCVEGEARPLKVGIFQDLAEALKDDEKVSKTQLRQALRQYTSNWRYLHGCRQGAQRVDLAGNDCGELEQQHVEHAAQQLQQAKEKLAQRRAEQRKADEPKERKNLRRTKSKDNKFTQPRRTQKPQFNLTPVNMLELQKDSQVKVKAGQRWQNAKVLDVMKDSARVELDNGLVINVTADRLFT
ncbi:ProP effector [Volucribacter psittacicida]|uniref:RNA chaperone ProQ n=1 Tax=Volucribacter psittacicida TaxID=203482 RepID=A0A4R1G571_9PAST|nr:RNA chaperone ProQ [Volucribacter psittacicida]TCK01663.1 ProP effector [Volucribacter psittacicida]